MNFLYLKFIFNLVNGKIVIKVADILAETYL